MNKDDLALINQYTRRNFSEEEIYTFSLTLCDNEIDRDFERFSDDALHTLAALFVGVTGITDHEPRSDNQTARIFRCHVDHPSGKTTSDGRPYLQLKADAYIPKADCSSRIITLIDSGIKKEVSVGCSVRNRICSVCGKDQNGCGHIRGHYYDNQLCFATLDNPTDAYEWSFVAVPAQKAAGVTKFYNKGELTHLNIEKRLNEGGEQTFSAEEMQLLAENYRRLSERAADGDAYRTRLEHDIGKMAAIALPELKKETLAFITGKMSAVQLEDLCSALTKKAAQSMPLKPQLTAVRNNGRSNNNDYKNI